MRVSLGLIKYIALRTFFYIFTIFVALTVIFFLIRLAPGNPIENIIELMLSQGSVYDPEAINMLRNSLYEMFGLKGSLFEQYINFMRRLLVFDFGPSLSNFPTPAIELIMMRLPWTIGLLSMTTIISWMVGNLLGALAGFFERSKFSKILQGIALTLYPIPYYVMALVMIFLFTYLIPLFPLSGGISILSEKITLEVITNLIWHAMLPALSLIIIGTLGWWFMSSRTLTINTKTEDFVTYAEIRGVSENRILRKYIIRNILMPQVTALGLALGSIFSGALLTEVIFAYPGLGDLLWRAINARDYNTIMGVTSLSTIAVATATYILDLIYPLIDPRVRYK